MKKQLLTGLVMGWLLVGSSGTAQALLKTIGTATYNGSDYKLIWDDDNNGNSMVWLDYTNSDAHWENQDTWATELESELTINLYNDYLITWDDDAWRLPATVDGLFDYGYDGTTTAGYNITNSEMGHLWYEELGNLGCYDTSGNYQSSGCDLQNTGDFDNLIAFGYWSGTDYVGPSDHAWYFDTNDGYQYVNSKDHGLYYGLAVRSGQVSAAPVPEPATMLLFGTGLAGLAGSRIRRKRRE